VLAGTSAGQVYRSQDGGRSWTDAGVPLPLAGWVISALHFDTNRPGRVWAGMWGMWGGVLVAYSDGITEAEGDDNRPFDDERMDVGRTQLGVEPSRIEQQRP